MKKNDETKKGSQEAEPHSMKEETGKNTHIGLTNYTAFYT